MTQQRLRTAVSLGSRVTVENVGQSRNARVIYIVGKGTKSGGKAIGMRALGIGAITRGMWVNLARNVKLLEPTRTKCVTVGIVDTIHVRIGMIML